MRTADIIKAQILTGQLLDHPSAALHYYAFELGELTATYRESVAPWVSSAWRFAEEDSTLEGAGALIGAPRAAIADSAVKAAIKNLADRCHHTLAERENDLHSLILAYNEFVTYAASIFAEATANRLTYHLGLLGRRDFILPDRSERPVGAYADGNALVVFTDKHSDHGLSFRAAAIPPVAVQQILALLDFVAYLAARLLDFSGGREASRGLQRILAGDRALFQKFKRVDSVPGELGYRLVRYKRRDFAELWPEIPVPAEHLRHRFTTVARRCGMNPSDIRIQMGHSMDFVPFGATDPDSPAEVRQPSCPRCSKSD
uniref:Uncharacterized protein n=1 Tax=Hyaloperonospora arabidopsidis (strain Emoy2) TaxID=559515 RepID=M4C646_HYAAE